ncbi:MAG: GAF domain-containing protein [Chloroflexota bacterium]
MQTPTLLTLTQQLRQLPTVTQAGVTLVNWITAEHGIAYLMLPTGLITSEGTERKPQIVRWLNDRSQWRDTQAPQLTDDGLFIPLYYNGRTQGIVVVEDVDESAYSIIPLVEILATRLDTEHTATMVFKARQLAEKINLANQLEEMLKDATQGIFSLFESINAVIYWFDESDGRGEAVAEHPSRVAIGRDLGFDGYTRFCELLDNQNPVIINEANDNPQTRTLRTMMRTIGAQQLVMTPMLASGRLVGAILLTFNQAEQERQLSGREQQLLQMLAQVMSNAILHLRRASEAKIELLDNTNFKQLIDKATVAIDIHAPDGEVIYRNQAWNDLFLRDPSEKQFFRDRLLNDEKSMANELIYPNATRTKGWTNFVTLKRKDGSEFDAHVSVVALRDANETVIGYSTITDDVTELHHVMDALQAQTTRLAAAASVSQVIITTSDLQQLADDSLRLICTQFGQDFAQIWQIDHSRNELICISATNAVGDVIETMQGQVTSLSQMRSAMWVINHDNVLLIDDAQNDDRHWQHPSLPLVGSELVILLQAAHQVIGVLVIQNRKSHAISTDDADVIQTIADQLGVAIFNTSLFTQLEERIADMTAMGAVSLLVQAAFDLDGLMRRIHEAMKRVHPTGDFTFAIQDKVSQMLTIVSYVDGQAKQTSRSIGDDLVSHMITQASPIFWLTADEQVATSAFFGFPHEQLSQSFIGLPVIAKDTVIGALYTESDAYGTFDENDLQFMLNLVNSAAFAIENMNLLDDTKRRVREMELVNSISHTLSETFGMRIMWDQLADDLEQLFLHGVVTIALLDSTTNRLHAPLIGNDQVMLASPPYALANVVMQNGISLVFHDLMTADSRLEALQIDPFTLNLGALRSWVGTPLKNRNNEPIGVIALQSNQADAFTDRDLSLLNMVAAQTSLALDNAYLLNAEQERREVANSLIDMGRIVTSTLNVDDVFARILEQIARLVNYERATILLPMPNSGSLFVYAVDGFEEIYRGQSLTVNQLSPLWSVIQSQEPIVIPRVHQSDKWQTQPDMLTLGQVKSWMGVPLVAQGQIRGVISLDTNGKIPYTFDDATHIFALARQASIAIDNAQLHTELEDNVRTLEIRSERLATMHHLANYVSSSLSQSAVLDHTANLLTDLFKASYACIIRIDDMDGNGYLVAEYPLMDTQGQSVMVKGTPAFYEFQEIVRNHTALMTPSDSALAQIIPADVTIEACAVAPLIAHERVLGCIILGLDDMANQFDEDNYETFMTIAAQIAVAIRNAELFQDAIEASRLKTEFLANVSHELRTPLNAIIGYSELLLSGTYGALEDLQEDRLERVYRSGRQLLALINDILDLSKIEAGKMDLDLVELQIERLIEDATSTLQPQIDFKGLALRVDLQDNLPSVYIDPQRMRQVLINLLSNAVKFTKEGTINVQVERSTISLREFPELPLHMTTQNNTWLHISVNDTGIGIDEKDQKIIFDAFTQADGSTIREYEGTGLGLAITQQIIKMHKGHIWLDSELGVGSTFHILIPSMEAVQAPRYASPPEDDRPLIVLIDEDEMTLQLMSEYLNPDLYNVITTRETQEIFKIADEIVPSLVIMDLLMPRAESLPLLEKVLSYPQLQDVPVVVCSILDREAEALEKGAVAYIKKPVTRRDLLNLIDELV